MNKHNLVGITTVASIGIILPLLGLFSGSSLAGLILINIARFSPILAIAAAAVSLYNIFRDGKSGALPHLAAPGIASLVLLGFAVLGAFSNLAQDSTSAIIYYILAVHVMAPLISVSAAIYAFVERKNENSNCARSYASTGLFSLFLMICIYGSLAFVN
ncbi:MAG: hypothetical protein K2X27_21915 [Candidatus Obscuribacterales bacterium]|nr:hypothetical protein [Candidatus Obscuribacterales bacterium]